MALDIVRGEIENLLVAQNLVSCLEEEVENGHLYLGYPVLSTPESLVKFDGLLVSPDVGLVVFKFAQLIPSNDEEWESLIEEQNAIFGAIDSHLRRHANLKIGRNLALEINVVTILSSSAATEAPPSDSVFSTLPELGQLFRTFSELEDYLFANLQSVIQRVSALKPVKKRLKITRLDSRGAIIQDIERLMANLDNHQLAAAIETPEGSQRIRGLAGSGKTVVIALKATLLHVQHPDWNIAVTFQSRTLYQQFEGFITRFCYDQIQDSPDFEKLKIQHAWGSASKGGIYYSICESIGLPPRDYNSASREFGREGAFRGICKELLEFAEEKAEIEGIFDAVLIDEAQDFPPEFFKLIYMFTKEPKRIVWAYDELQTLSQSVMPDVSDMFGIFPNGDPRMTLVTKPGEPRRDIVLPMCYRNSPWTLAVAHALGYGINRIGGLVQHFENPKMWEDVGYRVVNGQLTLGQPVTLERSPESTPSYFVDWLRPSDVIVARKFDSEGEQDRWIAEQIRVNLTEDELDPTDILIVLPTPITAQRRAHSIRNALYELEIPSHLVGVNSAVDSMYISDSIAIAHIYRAKGNEAAMVYVCDSQISVGEDNKVLKRNTLFTAITRSKAWVRICGFGSGMDVLLDEINKVVNKDYKLAFDIPSSAKLRELRRKDPSLRSVEEVELIEEKERELSRIIELIDNGEMLVSDIPAHLRKQLFERIQPTLDLNGA